MSSNFLDSGAVLPSGLLTHDRSLAMAGFNKSYKNYPMRLGFITKSYPASDENNHSKLTTEYDVLVIEQHEDKGVTTIIYRNCMSAEGIGAVGDFLEMNLRAITATTGKGESIKIEEQNGSVVLLMCLDGMSDKGIIIKQLTHPKRKTTLKDDQPHLEGEYNGVHIVVNSDGSTSLTFKGATDNDGKIIDDTQGPTEMSVEKDGSLQIKHKTITQRYDKNGKATLTADDDVSITTKTNLNVTTTKDVNITATGNMAATMKDLMLTASGSAMLECQKMTIKADSEINIKGSTLKIEAESLANIKAASIVLDGMVALGGPGGVPILLMTTMFLGIGNMGAPVISQAITSYATKVTAT